MDPTLAEQLKQLEPYRPWLMIAGVFVFFMLLRVTRRRLRRRVDEIGYRLFKERGLLIWFWLNAPKHVWPSTGRLGSDWAWCSSAAGCALRALSATCF